MVIGVGNKLRKLEYFDGIVGLGFPSRSQIGQTLENPTFNRYYLKWNFIDNMFKQMAGQISEYQFGIYVSNSDNYDDSEIAIGGKNPLKYKGFPKTFFTVTDPGGVWAIDSNPWTIQVLDISMPRPLANTPTIVSIDTGSSAIFLHNKTAHIINAQLGATFNVTDGRDYFPDCNVTDKHDVVLKANGFTFNIPPRNLYVPDFNNRTRCLSAIVRTEDTKPVVLGIAFLRSYYSVYTLGSKPSITFYDSIHDLNYGIQVLKQHIESLELQIQVRNKYQYLFPEDGSFDFVEDAEKKLEDYRNRLKIHELRMKSASLKLSL
ncbi:Vacuolar protease A [Globomyces sp. JEL0801]|nr:Vacuolar protease A [Globomyces sp. JEL0801]